MSSLDIKAQVFALMTDSESSVVSRLLRDVCQGPIQSSLAQEPFASAPSSSYAHCYGIVYEGNIIQDCKTAKAGRNSLGIFV